MYKFAILTLFISSCSFKVEVASQRTTLENQVMGTYKPLPTELVLAGVARSTRRLSAHEEQLAKANGFTVSRRELNAFDINELKEDQVIGETEEGVLELLPQKHGNKARPNKIAFAKHVIAQENEDRRQLWADQIKPGSTPVDHENSQVFREQALNFAKQTLSQIPEGHWYRNTKGLWIRKESAP